MQQNTAPTCSHLTTCIPMTYFLCNGKLENEREKNSKRQKNPAPSAARPLTHSFTVSTRSSLSLGVFIYEAKTQFNDTSGLPIREQRSSSSIPAVRKKQKHLRQSSVSGTEAATKALSTQSVFVSRIDSSAARGVFTRANSRLLFRKASVKRL